MRRARSLLTWFALLLGFWELLVGTFQGTEVLAGLIAAGIGAVFALALRRLGLFRFSLRTPHAVRILKLVWQLPVEFAVVTWVLAESLAHGRRVRGRWIRVPYPHGTYDVGRGERAHRAARRAAVRRRRVLDAGL